MTADEYITRWKAEEQAAHIRGWDFSLSIPAIRPKPICRGITRTLCVPIWSETAALLDMDTGGGEFLLSLGHPPGQDERDGRISSQRRAVPADAGFSVDACADRLLQAQGILEERGAIQGTIHRYLIVARRTGAQSKTE